MTKTQSKVRSAFSVFIALTLTLALAPFANAGKAYAEEGDGQTEQNADTQETNGTEANDQDAAASSTDGSQVDAAQEITRAEDGTWSPAPQKEEGVSVVTPSEDEIEALLLGLGESANEGISTYSLGADLLAAKDIDLQFFSGSTRIETSVLQAKSAFSTPEYAIIAGSNSWPDALTASGLAGAYRCPIMLTDNGDLNDIVAQALRGMGVKHVIILGDQYSVSDKAESTAKSIAGDVVRLAGKDRYETQLAIYEYGLKNNLWKGDLAIVANGGNTHFADALSSSPGAFAKAAPVFLVQASGEFNDAQKTALSTGAAKGLLQTIMVAGDTNSVSQSAQTFLNGVCPNGANNVNRIGGTDRYQTSAKIAEWMVGQKYLVWDNAAFSTGELAYDALGGGAAQGSVGSVLLLTREDNSVAADKLIQNKDAVNTSIRFYGGINSVSGKARSYITNGLGIAKITSTAYPISLDAMIAYEKKWYTTTSETDLKRYIDPANTKAGSAAFYQFADLGQGYTGLFSASDLNDYIAEKVKYTEGTKHVTSTMRGMGQTIIDAAKKYNINEVYLLCHAALESGWGCSSLAQGTVEGYANCYNFFGFGAYDSDPDEAGAKYAQDNGWTSPAKAMEGAAAVISSNYIHDPSFNQDTLYNMKWDLFNAMGDQKNHIEYATDIKWAESVAGVMSSMYGYFGLSQSATGLVFDVPQYQ